MSKNAKSMSAACLLGRDGAILSACITAKRLKMRIRSVCRIKIGGEPLWQDMFMENFSVVGRNKPQQLARENKFTVRSCCEYWKFCLQLCLVRKNLYREIEICWSKVMAVIKIPRSVNHHSATCNFSLGRSVFFSGFKKKCIKSWFC